MATCKHKKIDSEIQFFQVQANNVGFFLFYFFFPAARTFNEVLDVNGGVDTS